MKSIFYLAALAYLALAEPATAAFAGAGEPITSVPVGLEGDPGSIVVARGVTNERGQVNFGNLAPGKYRLVIDGRGLARALKKMDPKGSPHTIRVTFGLDGEKPIVVSNQPDNNPDAATLMIRVDTGNIGGDLARTKPHYYVGIVSLVK